MSVISEELSDFLNLKLSPTNIGVIGVSSIETKAIGKVDFIYEFQGCEKCLEITVLKNPSCSLLLKPKFMFDLHLTRKVRLLTTRKKILNYTECLPYIVLQHI